MHNKRLEKTVVKVGYGALFAMLMGLTYRLNKRTEEYIDEKYEREHGVKKKSKLI